MLRVLRELLGYVLGLALFVGLIPLLMWLVAGRPALCSETTAWQWIIGTILIVAGLVLSIWTIIHMRLVGRGNPMDAFGHEVAPRTQHLMTDGPYSFSRNPMLLGVYILLGGWMVILFSWQPILIFAAFFAIMLYQVTIEEKRLMNDFGTEYTDYCTKVHRYFGRKK